MGEAGEARQEAPTGVGPASAAGAASPCPNGFTKVHDKTHTTITLSACEELFVDSAGKHTIVWQGGIVIVHGAGTDKMDYSQASDDVGGEIDATLSRGTVEHEGHIGRVRNSKGQLVLAKVGTIGMDRISGIADVTGTPFDDIIKGDANDNHLEGGAGNDHLYAVGNTSTMYGGEGHDLCVATGFTPGCADGAAGWS